LNLFNAGMAQIYLQGGLQNVNSIDTGCLNIQMKKFNSDDQSSGNLLSFGTDYYFEQVDAEGRCLDEYKNEISYTLEYRYPPGGSRNGFIFATIDNVECNAQYNQFCNDESVPYFMQGFSFIGARSVSAWIGNQSTELTTECELDFIRQGLLYPLYVNHQGCDTALSFDRNSLLATLEFFPLGFGDSRTIIANFAFELWGFERMVINDQTACNSITFEVSNRCDFMSCE